MNNENIKIDQTETDTPVDLPVIKSPWFKNKKILTGIVVCIFIVAVILYFLLLKIKSDDISTMQSEQNTVQSNKADVEEVSEVKALIEGVPGIRFTVPKKWTVSRSDVSDGLSIYTDDAVPGDMSGINAGNTIHVFKADRDFAKEASSNDPLDTYADSIGAPRIGDADTDNRPLDLSKYTKFTNKEGLKMMAFPWRYEGCYEHVIFLGEKFTYKLSIADGKDCPDNTTLTTNTKIKEFIDSINLTDEAPLLDLQDSAYIFNQTTEQSGISARQAQVQTKNVTFSFQSLTSLTGYTLLSETMVARFSNQDEFEKLLIGSSRQGEADAYNRCKECSPGPLHYDESIVYSSLAVPTDGYTNITDNVYGMKKSIDPVHPGAVATTFTYVRIIGEGSFTITFTLESSDSNINAKIPELENEDLIKMVESIKLL